MKPVAVKGPVVFLNPISVAQGTSLFTKVRGASVDVGWGLFVDIKKIKGPLVIIGRGLWWSWNTFPWRKKLGFPLR